MKWLNLFRRGRGKPAVAAPLQRTLPAPEPAETIAEPAPRPRQPTPDEVRRLLFDAVASRDEERLESLCREHKDFILEHGAGWLDVPPTFRASPDAHEWYRNGLRAVARFCAERLGHTALLDRL